MARKFSLALGLLVLCSLTISGARKPKLSITFHLEGAQSDGAKMVQPIKLGNPPQISYFRRAPELSKRHITGYYPFPANDGSGYGVAFQLNQSGTEALKVISTIEQNRKLMTVIDSEPVDFIVMNQPINDGYVVVWGGLKKADLDKFKAEFKQIKPSASGRPSIERATTPRDTLEESRTSATGKPKKERKRLLDFGKRKKD